MMINTKGSMIIESVIAISIFSLFILIFGSTYTLINTGQFLKHKNLAYYLALEEIEVLRQTPFADLSNRADADFIGTAYNTGNWSVNTQASAPSSPNVYRVTPLSSGASGVSGLATVPGFAYNDFSVSSEIMVSNSSPANWESGIFFRYQDKDNFYYAGFNASDLVLNKVVDGVETELDSAADIYSKNTWYTLKISASGSSIVVYVDDVEEINTTDEEFSNGRIALASYESAIAYFDDVAITTSDTTTWDFDSDTTGETAMAWQRFGINDLPNGATKLTIEDDQPGYESLKKVTAEVEWKEKNNTKSIQIITLINQ